MDISTALLIQGFIAFIIGVAFIIIILRKMQKKTNDHWKLYKREQRLRKDIQNTLYGMAGGVEPDYVDTDSILVFNKKGYGKINSLPPELREKLGVSEFINREFVLNHTTINGEPVVIIDTQKLWEFCDKLYKKGVIE